MFCTKCGQQIPDDSKFCEFCGASFEESAGDQGSAANASPVDAIKNNVNDFVNGKKNDKQLLIIGAVAVVALLLIFVVINAVFGSSPKKTLKKYIKGAAEMDFKDAWNSSLSAKNAQKKLDVYDEDDYEDAYDEAKDYFDEAKEEMEDEDVEIKVKVDVKDVEKIGKSDREFEWACEWLEDQDYDSDKVKKFAIVKARVKLTYYEDGDKEDTDSETTEYLLVKLGGSWYVTDLTSDDIEEYLKDRYK